MTITKRVGIIVLSLYMVFCLNPCLDTAIVAYGADNQSSWTDWNENKPDEMEGRTIESKIQYRYRDKETVYSGKDSLSGYTKSGTETLSTAYSDWSPSSENRCKASDTKGDSYRTLVTVETKTAYKSFAWYCKCEKWSWKTKTGKCKYCGKATSNKKFNIYTTKSLSASGYPKDSANDGSYVLPKTISIASPGKMGTMYCMRYGGPDGIIKSFTSKMVTGKIYLFADGTKPVSRTKTVKSRNVFWKWGNWKNWSDAKVQGSASRQVETKTVYRYRDNDSSSVSTDKKNISDCKTTVIGPSTFTYDGNTKALNIEVCSDQSNSGTTKPEENYDWDEDVDFDDEDTDEEYYDSTSVEDTTELVPLVENKDYTISGNAGVNAGTYKVTITGIGDYYGSTQISFSIKKANLRFSFNKNNVSVKEGSAIVPVGVANPEYATVIYKSSNSKIATIDSKGKITAKAPGRTVITGTATKGSNYNAKSDSYTLDIKSLPVPGKISNKSVKVSVKYGQATIKWNKAKNANKYEVSYKAKGASKWISEISTSNTYSVNNLAPSKQYKVRIRPLNANGSVTKKGSFTKKKKIKTKANYNILYYYDTYKYYNPSFAKPIGGKHILYVPKDSKFKFRIPNLKVYEYDGTVNAAGGDPWFAIKRSDGKYWARQTKKWYSYSKAVKLNKTGEFDFFTQGNWCKISSRMLKDNKNAWFEIVPETK